MFDNPQLNHTQGFNVNYTDLNDNKKPDDDEYITAILPNYTGIDSQKAIDYVNEAVREKVLDEDKIAALRYFHDKLIEDTELAEINSTLINPVRSCY